MDRTEVLEALVRVPNQKFTNEQHFGFHSENRSIFTRFSYAALGIQPFEEAYGKAVDDEDAAMEQIRRSADTSRIAAADAEFDESYSGMHTYLQACLKHVDHNIRHAAQNLDVVFAQYGNIGRYPYRQELAMSMNLLQDLDARAADVNTVALTVWMDAHRQAAVRLRQLIDARSDETAAKTTLRVIETRRQTDNVYLRLIARLEAMININGADYVPGFLAAYNTHATEYKNTLAQHLGRIHANKAKAKGNGDKAQNASPDSIADTETEMEASE
jgi:hypothetical protein